MSASLPPDDARAVQAKVSVGDVWLAYLQAGPGPHTVVLLHGWPQTSHAWRRVTPLLGAGLTSIAFDLPGVGRSAPEGHGFDKASMAAVVHAALANLGIERPILVGHDIGALVAYAFARRYPSDLSGLVIVDTPLPGVAGWEETIASSAYWHLGFHREVGRRRPIANALVSGREAVYFRSFIDRFAAYPDAISDDDIAVYARGYEGDDRLEAGFSMFRTLALDLSDNEAGLGDFPVPVLAAFCEFSHATVLEIFANGLRRAGAANVRTALLPDCGHWPAEERPVALARIVREFVTSLPLSGGSR